MPLLQKKVKNAFSPRCLHPEPLLVGKGRGRTVGVRYQPQLEIGAFRRRCRYSDRRVTGTRALGKGGGSHRFSPLSPGIIALGPGEGNGGITGFLEMVPIEHPTSGEPALPRTACDSLEVGARSPPRDRREDLRRWPLLPSDAAPCCNHSQARDPPCCASRFSLFSSPHGGRPRTSVRPRSDGRASCSRTLALNRRGGWRLAGAIMRLRLRSGESRQLCELLPI
jgi:hypothetical protein